MSMKRGAEWRRPRAVARAVCLVGVASLALFGCRRGTSEARSAVKVVTSTPAAQWSATRDLRIGGTGNAALPLTLVGPMAVGPDGNVYVAQPRDHVIRVFDAQGRPLRTIGGLGTAPGRFREIVEVGFVADTLYVVDPALTRVTLFSTDGSVLGTLSIVPHGLSGPFQEVLPVQLCPNGTAIVTPMIFNGASVADIPRVPYLRVDRDGRILDTLAFRRRSHAPMPLHGRGVLMTTQPFSDGSLVALSRHGERIAVVDRIVPDQPSDATYRVTVSTSYRDAVYAHAYPYSPIPMEAAWADSTIARLARAARAVFTSSQQAEDTIRKAMYVPKYALAVTNVLFSASGELWLQREDIPNHDESWIVLDTLGMPAAHVTLPEGFQVRTVGKDAIWGTVTDSTGVPYVERYRIER